MKWPDSFFGKRLRLPELSLEVALLLIIFVAGMVVTAGYIMYLSDENYKYDLARPDDDDKNKSLSAEETEINDTTSPVDLEAVKAKQGFLETELQNLRELNAFDEKPVSGKSMQLDPEATPSL